jgi:hypothetical protein
MLQRGRELPGGGGTAPSDQGFVGCKSRKIGTLIGGRDFFSGMPEGTAGMTPGLSSASP